MIDRIDAQAECVLSADDDGDCMTNAQEGCQITIPPDADGDGTPDYLDLDSDNDGIWDGDEVGPDCDNPRALASASPNPPFIVKLLIAAVARPPQWADYNSAGAICCPYLHFSRLSSPFRLRPRSYGSPNPHPR